MIDTTRSRLYFALLMQLHLIYLSHRNKEAISKKNRERQRLAREVKKQGHIFILLHSILNIAL
jgi:hypothetical protein